MGEMDSGNSASLQSSSTGGGGGDEQEFESSRGGGVLFDQGCSSMAAAGSFNNTVPFQLYSTSSFANHPSQVSNFNHFDTPTFLQSSSPNSNNFILNQNINYTNDLNHNHNRNHSNNNNNNNYLGMVWPNKYTSSSMNNNQPQRPPPLPIQATRATPVSAESSPRSLDHQGSGGGGGGGGGGGRNPKKRSRASRRAPTTVLTTDTSNFRQMVQEFTGIPAPPFAAASSAFSGRTRLDLFGGLGFQLPRGVGNNNSNNNNNVGLLDVSSSLAVQSPPPYLLRPFPHKVVHHPPNHSTTTTTSVLNIQSLLQRPPSLSEAAVEKFRVPDFQPGDPSTSLGPKVTEFALGHVTSTSTTTTTSVIGSGSSDMMMSILGNERVTRGEGRSYNVDAGANAAKVDSGGGGAPPHGGVTRGECMVDSWICSSSSD